MKGMYVLQLGNGDNQIRPSWMNDPPSAASSALARPEPSGFPWLLVLGALLLFLVMNDE